MAAQCREEDVVDREHYLAVGAKYFVARATEELQVRPASEDEVVQPVTGFVAKHDALLPSVSLSLVGASAATSASVSESSKRAGTDGADRHELVRSHVDGKDVEPDGGEPTDAAAFDAETLSDSSDVTDLTGRSVGPDGGLLEKGQGGDSRPRKLTKISAFADFGVTPSARHDFFVVRPAVGPLAADGALERVTDSP